MSGRSRHGHPGMGREGSQVRTGMRHREGARKQSLRTLSRRSFLKVGGAGLAGAALLGPAGCGGGGQQGGGELVFIASPDDTGTASKLVDKYNESNQGEIRV